MEVKGAHCGKQACTWQTKFSIWKIAYSCPIGNSGQAEPERPAQIIRQFLQFYFAQKKTSGLPPPAFK